MACRLADGHFHTTGEVAAEYNMGILEPDIVADLALQDGFMAYHSFIILCYYSVTAFMAEYLVP